MNGIPDRPMKTMPHDQTTGLYFDMGGWHLDLGDIHKPFMAEEITRRYNGFGELLEALKPFAEMFQDCWGLPDDLRLYVTPDWEHSISDSDTLVADLRRAAEVYRKLVELADKEAGEK